MNKTKVFEQLKIEIESNLKLALNAAQNTYAIATDEDSKAENKYDTRGLEASYLAGAQAERVFDLKDTLNTIVNINIKNFDHQSKIALTALINLHSIDNDKTLWVLLLPKGGGQSCKFENETIQVITPESPLGSSLIGREVGETIKINQREYEITSLS